MIFQEIEKFVLLFLVPYILLYCGCGVLAISLSTSSIVFDFVGSHLALLFLRYLF